MNTSQADVYYNIRVTDCMQIMISVHYNINNNYASSKKATLKCPKCAEEISLDECFKDKAAENELKTATIKCTNQGCPWQGPGRFYMVSTKVTGLWLYLFYACSILTDCQVAISSSIAEHTLTYRSTLPLASSRRSPGLIVSSMAVPNYYCIANRRSIWRVKQE